MMNVVTIYVQIGDDHSAMFDSDVGTLPGYKGDRWRGDRNKLIILHLSFNLLLNTLRRQSTLW